MDLATYTATFTEDDSPGWAAIDAACAKVYGAGEPLGHYAPPVPPILGGDGPDGTSIYAADGHLHYVTYGFSRLHYDEASAGEEFSGFGFELTFRLKSDAVTRDTAPMWPISVMQNLYRYVHQSGRWFEPKQAVPTVKTPLNSDIGFDESVITGLIFEEDPQFGTIQTPHGAVQFLQMIGITKDEAEAFSASNLDPAALITRLRTVSTLLVTDMARGL